MKKLSILFLSVLALGTTLTSCSKSDSAPELAVAGKWNFVSYRTLDTTGKPTGAVTALDGLNGQNDQSCTPINVDAIAFGDIAATPTNGVYTDFPTSGCDSTPYPFSYSRKGNTITITGLPIDPLVFDVVSSTTTQLTVNLKGTQMGDIQIVLNKA